MAVYPQASWDRKIADGVGEAPTALAPAVARLSQAVGGNGCVISGGRMVGVWGDVTRVGDVASAFKPVLSMLLLMAVERGLIGSVDEALGGVEPALRAEALQAAGAGLEKHAGITWRQLAHQTSGYGLIEPPGAAYSYNDFALALYYDTLMNRVFRRPGTEVLRALLAEPLQFEDACSFEAFGPQDRPGRLAVSVRDFARFGWLMLCRGRWRDHALLKPETVALATQSPLPADTPLASAADGPMLPGQRSIGGTRRITPVGPGFYSFNWWVNGVDAQGRRLFPGAPVDAYCASGHGGKRVLLILPSLQRVVCWNESTIDDHDQSPGQPQSRLNRAVAAACAPELQA